ncbi:MAG TPA: phytanoyl-CoA dioxygenase family protein [Acidobacteriaceae bacterium]|nr:phytanoyl-CoA dioxygenase family protein [Acidobacteriaceae bacterium]
MLSLEQQRFYEENGYLCPLRVFSESETSQFRRQFDEYTAENQERLQQLIPRERRAVYGLTHLSLPWVYEMASHPRVLDAVEGAIGPNILVWGSDWFVKFPGDAAFISWHQDGAYWGLQPPKVTTAWIALSPSTLESGCMQVMPGTQKTQFAQRETYARDNALSRGQEIAVDVDESKAVPLSLAPGEMSLHHIGIAHGSKANNADYARVGIAVRYIAPEVVQNGSERQIVQLVRGKDDYGNFEIVGPPEEAASAAGVRKKAEERMLRNVYPAAK